MKNMKKKETEMKNRLLKTFTSLVLTALMVISVMPAFAITIGAAGDTYELVTDASTLAVGDTVIIVAAGYDYAMSTNQKSSNRGQATVTKNSDGTITIGTDVQVFTLEAGTTTGTFAFKTNSENSGYIYCASTAKSSSLKSKTNLDGSASWSISIKNGVATIKSNTSTTTERTLLRYNYNNGSGLFSCYANGQNDVSIYKLKGNAEETTTEGSSGTDTPETPACEHTNTEAIGEAKEATCTTPGTTAGVVCSGCGEILEAQTSIPATGHTYENGECTVCHKKQPTTLTINRDSFGSASGYAWHGWSAAATTGETITGSGFIYGDTKNSMQMNSSKTGNYIYNSVELPGSIVSVKLKVSKSMAADRYFDVLTSAEPYNHKTAPKLDATDNKKVVTTDGITWEFENGGRYFAIVVTGGAAYLSSIEITYEPCSHANTEPAGAAKEATCTEDGNTAGEKCADCGKILKAQEPIPATGHKDENNDNTCDVCDAQLCTKHDWVGGEIIKAPTCTETGLQAQYCSICNQPNPENKVLEMIDHTPEKDAAIEPTCTSTGLTQGSHCSVCNTVIVKQTVVPMKDHDYVDNKCTVCGDIKVQGSQLGVFQFGDNGSGVHDDGKLIAENTSYTSGNYTLTFTSASKVYGEAFDATGNSALKLGTSSAAASLSFTVNSDVNTVVIYIAGYKDEKANIKINNSTEYEITSKSDEGNYTKVVVDTTTNKTVTLETLKGGYRAMIDSIEFWGYAPVVKSFSLSLNEGVTVKVTFDIPEAWLNANEGAKVVFSNDKEFVITEAGEKVYSVDLTPKQINDDLTVKIQLADGSDYGATNNVSVSTYMEKVKAAYTSGKLSYTKEKYDALIALLNAALTYSSVADGTYKGADLENNFDGVADHSYSGGLFTGFEGQLGTDASIFINVNTANVQEEEKLILTVGGTKIINGQIADYITKDHRIVITGLYPQHFDDKISIDTTIEGSKAEFTFNSYLKAIYNAESSDQSVKNLAVATYLYGLAAEAYLTVQ